MQKQGVAHSSYGSFPSLQMTLIKYFLSKNSGLDTNS